jgi:hypothetical protein
VVLQGVSHQPEKEFRIVPNALFLQLLTREATKRLGTGPGDADEIKRHNFFQGIDFEGMMDGRVPAPWQPNIVVSRTHHC